MAHRHRRHEDHEEHPSEAWLIALADMMTLLMVTFLMMFAISSLDLKKFQTFKEAFAKGTGTVLPQLPGEGVPTEGDISKKPLAPKDGDPKPQASAWAANVGGPSKPVLAKTDPPAFAQRRAAVIEAVIANAPLERQQQLRRLQWRIDMERQRCSNPLQACIRISNMMWDMIYADRGFLWALQVMSDPHALINAGPEENVLAEVVRLKPKR